MTKLEKLKEAFKDHEDGMLEYLAYHSWCTLELGKSYRPTIDMLDDLYCGFVSGVMYNLGSGKTPEYMDEIGPSPEERHSKESYSKLWFELIHLGKITYEKEEWLLKNPESEEWAKWIEEALILENSYNQNPEKWLIEFRNQLINRLTKNN